MPETGVLISWDGKQTKLWAACDRAKAPSAVWELSRLWAAWFREPGVRAEFGTVSGPDQKFTASETLDLQALQIVA